MKRVFLTVAAAAILSAAAGALPISVGSGVVFGTEAVKLDYDNNRFDMKQNYIGLSTFFDAHYVSLGIDLMNGNVDLSGRAFREDENAPGTYSLNQVVQSYSALMLDINLLGKLPLPLFGLEQVSVFPMLGAGFKMVQIVQEQTPLFGAYNDIKILFGVGGDFDISERVFLRFVLLPHYALAIPSTKIIVASHFDKPNWSAHGGFGASGHIMAGFRFGALD